MLTALQSQLVLWFHQLPLLQDDDSEIVRNWKAFADFVNDYVLLVYHFFVDIYPLGWLYLLIGLWMAIMLFWAKEFPNALRYSYYFLFLLYVVSLPYMMIYFS